VDRSSAFVRRLLPTVLAILVASACQVRTAVTVDVDDDGSGTVEVAAGLDEEALSNLPDLDGNGVSDADDLAALVRTSDLVTSGWTVGEPEAAGDGTTWVRVTHPFGTPEEADQVLAQLTDPDGPLRHLHVTRRDPFGRTQFGFKGTVDLSGGLESFGDEGLAAALGGEALGEDPAAIEARTGQPLEDQFSLEITANLGGASKSWHPRLGDPPLAMEHDGTVYHWPALALVAVALVAVVALVMVMVWRAFGTAVRMSRSGGPGAPGAPGAPPPAAS
jgi:hypothetical protein